MTTPAIHVQNLCKSFGQVLAVNNINFQVATGELVGFLGLNGAGKSTTIRILTTYIPASSGYAWINGHDVMFQSMEARQCLGYLPESVPLYPEMRVEEYLTMRAKLRGVDRTQRTSRIDYCLQRCRIREVQRRLIGTLSKGYRQRVGLADALLANPKVLILDEPLSGLDPIQQEETLKTIRDLRGEHTVLFSSHQLTDVEKICDRVIIIHRGTICFDNKLSQLSTKSPVVLAEVRGPADEIAKVMKKVPGVAGVTVATLTEGWLECRLTTDKERDPREAIAGAIATNHWGLRKLELHRERLEDTFMSVAYGK